MLMPPPVPVTLAREKTAEIQILDAHHVCVSYTLLTSPNDKIVYTVPGSTYVGVAHPIRLPLLLSMLH